MGFRDLFFQGYWIIIIYFNKSISKTGQQTKIFEESRKVKLNISSLVFYLFKGFSRLVRSRNAYSCTQALALDPDRFRQNLLRLLNIPMNQFHEGLNPEPDESNSRDQQPFLIVYNYRQAMTSRRRKQLRNSLKQRKRAANTDHNQWQSSNYDQEQQGCIGYEQQKLWDVFYSQELSKHQLHRCSTEAVVKSPEMNGCGIKPSNQSSFFRKLKGQAYKKRSYSFRLFALLVTQLIAE